MKNKIEQIKQKQDKLADLLDLYKKVVENEGRLYHLFEDAEVNNKDNWTDTFKCECGRTGQRWLYHIPETFEYSNHIQNWSLIACEEDGETHLLQSIELNTFCMHEGGH